MTLLHRGVGPDPAASQGRTVTLLRGSRGGETRVEFQQDAGKASGSLPKDATKNLKNNLKPKNLQHDYLAVCC